MGAPFLNLPNHGVPLATVCITQCSYTYQHKREMCTQAARKVWWVFSVGMFLCSRHSNSTRFSSTVWNRAFIEGVVVCQLQDVAGMKVTHNSKMTGIITSSSTVLPEKLTVSGLARISSASYGTGMFIITLTRARPLSLS